MDDTHEKEAKTAADKFEEMHFNGHVWITTIAAAKIARIYAKQASQDYESALADQRRLVRELDVLINGEEGAAKQASLCDIVVQIKKDGLAPTKQTNQQLADVAQKVIDCAEARAIKDWDCLHMYLSEAAQLARAALAAIKEQSA